MNRPGRRGGTVTGITGSNGTVSFTTGNMSGPSVTLTVDDVTADGMTYEPAAKVDSAMTIER
jgi:hypothetical protein